MALILGLVWLVAANFAAMFPSRRSHWPTAYVLIAIGLPLLVWIFATDGIWIALLILIAGASILRWPVWYLWRWLNARIGRQV